ncbi:MAG: adenosylcobinamide-phosphate synthase CbiB [Planctomycetota bacterium]
MTMLEWKATVLVSAVGIDLLFGEPHNRFHPVAWMGSIIGNLQRFGSSSNWLASLMWGLAITVAGSVVLMFLGIVVEFAAPPRVREHDVSLLLVLGLLLNASMLKSCVGIRSLWNASNSVRDALSVGDLPEARRCLAYHLVSRDVRNLGESEISAATIESVAENTSDSVIAPVFFYLVAGMPGALVYRYINTCDAMLGYRTPSLEWLGKVPARTDDLLNLIPARITAALMLLPSLPKRHRFSRALGIWWADSGKTESPNAGHPMSVAAGLIGIRLEKEGHYVLGERLRSPCHEDIATMNSLFQCTVLLAVSFVLVLCLVGEGLNP